MNKFFENYYTKFFHLFSGTLPNNISLSFFVLILLFFVINPSFDHAICANWRLEPILSVGGGYDDNVYYSDENKAGSSIVSLQPELEAVYRTLLTTLTVNAKLELLNYFDESELNRVDQNYRLDAVHRFAQRWDVRAGFRYISDTTLNTYLEETGRLVERNDRDYYYTSAGISYDITRISSIDVDYQFENAQYENDTYPDYDRHRVYLRYRHQLKNQEDTLLVGPSFYHRSNDLNDTDYMSLDFGWRRKWSEITNSYASIGARYTNIERQDGDDNDNWGARARLNLNYNGLVSTISFDYYHDLATTTEGNDVNVDNFHLQYKYLLTEKFGAGINGRLIFSYDMFNSNDNDEVQDRRYFNVEPFLFYRLTENFKAFLRYSYQNSSDKPIENDDAKDRNRVWVEFTYQFPITI